MLHLELLHIDRNRVTKVNEMTKTLFSQVVGLDSIFHRVTLACDEGWNLVREGLGRRRKRLEHQNRKLRKMARKKESNQPKGKKTMLPADSSL